MAENGTSLKVKYDDTGRRGKEKLILSVGGVTYTVENIRNKETKEVWQEIQDNLIKKAIEKANKERGGGTTKKKKGSGTSR